MSIIPKCIFLYKNFSSLVWAAGRKHSGVVRRLLEAGARPNSCDKYGTSALTWAARAGDAVSCGALLAAGADPNTAGMYCWTPLLQATQGDYLITNTFLSHPSYIFSVGILFIIHGLILMIILESWSRDCQRKTSFWYIIRRMHSF